MIVGAGGHGHVVADILLQSWTGDGKLRPIGFVDDAASRREAPLGLPILGTIAALRTIDHDGIVVAIGDNRRRADVFAALLAAGERPVVARHPSAIVAADVRIGAGTVLCAGAIVNPATEIGRNVILNTGATLDHHNRIGDHAHLAPGVHTAGDVQVGEGALVGIGAVLLPGRRIGAWSVVGAGGAVHRDVHERTKVVGVPARVMVAREQS